MHAKHPAIIQLKDIDHLEAIAFHRAKDVVYLNAVFALKPGEYAKVAEGMLLTDGVEPRYFLGNTLPSIAQEPATTDDNKEETEKGKRGKAKQQFAPPPTTDGATITE